MSDFSTPILSRDVRQRGLVPPDRLARCHAIVIGVGAIGRQVALQLAALGVSRMTLFDDDTVQAENLAPQGYWPEDLEHAKVRATAEICRRIHPPLYVTAVPERFKRSTLRETTIDSEPILFGCVDRIASRRMIGDSARSSASFFVDGRRSAEVLRVLAVNEPAIEDSY